MRVALFFRQTIPRLAALETFDGLAELARGHAFGDVHDCAAFGARLAVSRTVMSVRTSTL